MAMIAMFASVRAPRTTANTATMTPRKRIRIGVDILSDYPSAAAGYPLPMLVLWDRDGGFCAWMLSLFLRADSQRTLRTVHVRSPEGDRHLAGIAPERRLTSWHVVDAEGRLSSGGDAAPSTGG